MNESESINEARLTGRRPMQVLRRTFRRLPKLSGCLLLGLWIVLAMRGSVVLPNQAPATMDEFIAAQRFDIVVWEVQALLDKGLTRLRYPAPGLAGLNSSFYVHDYLALSADVRQKEQEIETAYALLPSAESHSQTIRELEETLAALRERQRAMQPLVETIIERQVARTIQRSGLSTGGLVWPPIIFHLASPPLHLVVSPRDRIELADSADLISDLSLTEREELEAALDRELEVSSLVENLGGYGAYPPLVLEYASLVWLTNTVAHEWIHNYLVFHPLGNSYANSPAMSTINETVASLAGDELGAQVIADYYPWLTTPELSWKRPRRSAEENTPPKTEGPGFDYGAFMRETRLETDRLLAASEIAAAENYMEARRQELLEQGYVIRKLNQAYFAFHGLYAISPGAVDPTGPKIEDLRRKLPSLRDFMHLAQRFRSPMDLEEALGD